MYIIVGLGNPEEDYARTRHNMGFEVINEIAEKYQFTVDKKKFKGLCQMVTIEGQKVLLLKPQTYMNLSGESIREAMDYYKVDPKEILVIYDDMDLETGIIKIRKKGGAGSHNGMKSVVKQLGTEEFPRIRIGIGKPEGPYDKINYVIGHIPDKEYEVLQQGIKQAAKGVVAILTQGIDVAMNKYN